MASSSSSFAAAAPSATNFVSIKLDHNNYPVWCAQFLPLLRSVNLLSFVTGENKCPSAFLLDDNGKFTDKVNPMYSKWIQIDQVILSWITSSLTPKVLVTIVNKIDSASAWSSLQEQYASTSMNSIIQQMRTELMNTSRGDLSIADYLDKVNVLADNLALYGAPVSESDLVAIIMSKVGPRYETTVASAQARDTPITYNALEALLLSTTDDTPITYNALEALLLSAADGLSDDLVWKYDVFISFRGQDTRDFVSHLLRAFDQKSISTFADAKELKSGEYLSEELRKAIQQSRLSIVVFSENYASSTWCLKELVQMVEQVKMTGRVLLVPVFYGVDPSEVHGATGAFAEAFARYEREMKKEDVCTWRRALTVAADYFGWNIKDYRNDAELIEEIVQSVFNKLIRWSSFEGDWKYDVFLNFRGEDTRKSFSSHLYKALYQKRINTFMDDEELIKGNSLSELLKCIKKSRVSIVVFSKDYASSTWCLKELVQILKCMDEQNQIVVPVFYEVDPSRVYKPKAFAKHDRDSKVEKEEVESWKSALKRATELTPPRWDSRNYEDDVKLIEDIVKHISGKLSRFAILQMGHV